MLLLKRSGGFLLFLLVLPFVSLQAQDPPMEWGNIPIEDLKMTTFPDDSNASAVILGDFGESKFDDDLNLIFTRHLRVKLLSQRGFSWATHTIFFHKKDNIERVSEIEGVTYVLQPDGDVEEFELEDDDIMEQDIAGSTSRYSFTLPNLQPGCVIEIRYRLDTERWWYIQDWEFQYTEPARWSEYRVIAPKNIQYAAVYQGYEPFVIQESKEINGFFAGRAEALIGKKMAPCTYVRLAVKNAPAIRSEPFITTREDYINRVDLQLRATSFVEDGFRPYMNDWAKLISDLLESDGFGELCKPTSETKKLAAEVTAGMNMSGDKARALYRWVRDNMVWSGSYWKYSSRDIEDILTSRKGNSAELSFLLVALFRSAGLESDPVIVSTRSNRFIQELYPIEAQFNHVIVRVRAAGSMYFVDGTANHRPFELPPVNVLNRKGLVVSPKNESFVNFVAPRQDDRSALAGMNISTDGRIDGTIEVKYQDYAAAEERNTLAGETTQPKDLLTNVLRADVRPFTIDSAEVMFEDSVEVPLVVKGTFHSDAFAQSAGDILYVNPHIAFPRLQNPFTLASRKYPVDYAYPNTTTSVVTINIPEGYEVKDAPANRSVMSASGNVEFMRTTERVGRTVKLRTVFKIVKSEIVPAEYPSLRDVYAAAVQAMGEQMVLEKKAPAAVPQDQPKPAIKTKTVGKKS